MGRKPRIHFQGACYHVIVRGNGRRPIFFTVGDRQRFLALVGEGVGRFEHQVHAYCLMTNHAHFAIQVSAVPLWKIVHNLCFRYSRYVHRRLGRSGHLFERRYRAGLVDGTRSLTRLVRYIHRNPVEAGMTGDPLAHRWSSHRAYLCPPAPSWLTTSLVLGLFHGDGKAARRNLQEFVLASDEKPGEWRPDLLLGDVAPPDACSKPHRRPLDCRLETIVEVVARVTGVDGDQLVAGSRRMPATRARALAALIVRDHSSFSLRALGDLLGREASSLSCAASRWEQAPRARRAALDRDRRAALELLASIRTD